MKYILFKVKATIVLTMQDVTCTVLLHSHKLDQVKEIIAKKKKKKNT